MPGVERVCYLARVRPDRLDEYRDNIEKIVSERIGGTAAGRGA